MTLRPFSIGSVRIDIPLTLAPMAGQTNYPFRAICREKGDCGLICTELLSSQAIWYKNQKTLKMFDWDRSESPFAVQLYGSDPTMMAESARVVADYGADIVDINMGCWVPKVAKTGAGAALLRDVCTAVRVVESVVKAVAVPVTVKVRAGFESGNPTAFAFAKAAEQVGVKAIAVHARYADQGFSGRADWSIIQRVKELVRIPVIGNGDVQSPEDAARMFAETGCDAVMIGRGALGNPWIFRQIAHFLQTGQHLPKPSIAEMAETALRHARLAVDKSQIGERQTVKELRGQITKYHFGARYAAVMRDQLVRCETLAEIEALLTPYLEPTPATRIA